MTGPVLDLEALRVTIIADAQSFVNEAQRMITTNDAMMKSIGRLNGMAASVTRVMGGLALGVDTLGQSFKNAKLGADAGAISRLGVNLKSLTDASIAKGLTGLASGLDAVAGAGIDKTVGTIKSLMDALRPLNARNNLTQAFTKATVTNLKGLGDALGGLKFSRTGLTYLAGLIDLLPKLSSTLVGMELSSKISRASLKSLDALTSSLQKLSSISPAKITAIMDALGGGSAATGLASNAKALAAVAVNAQTLASATTAVAGSIAPSPIKFASDRFTVRVRAQRDAAARALAAQNFIGPEAFTGPVSIAPARIPLPMTSPIVQSPYSGAAMNMGIYGQPSRTGQALPVPRFISGLQRDALAREASLAQEQLAKAVAQQRLQAAMLRLDEVSKTAIPTVGNLFGRAFTSISGMFASSAASAAAVVPPMATIPPIIKDIGDKTRDAAPRVGRLSASMNMLGRSAIGARTSMGLTQLTVAGFAGFSLVQFAHFETGITRMLARMADYQQRFRLLTTDAIMGTSGRSITPVTDVSAGFGTLSAVGMNVPMALQALPIAENFAVASGMAMATATRHLTSVLSALGLASRDTSVYLENMTRLSDAFIRTSQLVDVSVEELSESFNARFAASLRQVNGSMEEGIGIIAAYAAANVRGGDAGNRASIVFQALEHAMIGHLHTWQALGITIQDSNGNMKPMADIIQMLEQRLAGLNPVVQRATLQAAGFESRVTQALYPLLGFSNLIRETENNLRSIGGTTESVAVMIRSSFGSQITILWNNLKNMAIDIGRVVAPAVGWLASGIRSVSQWFHLLNPEVQRFLVIGTAIAASGGLLGFLGTGIGTVLSPVLAVVGFLLTQLGVLVSSVTLVGLVLTPFVLTLGTIASAIGALTVVNALGGWENTLSAVYAFTSRIPGGLGLAVRLMFDFRNTADDIRSDFVSIWERIRAISGTTFGFFFNFSENMSILKNWLNADQANDFARSWAILDAVWKNLQHNVGVVFGRVGQYFVWLRDNFDNMVMDIGLIGSRLWQGFVAATQTVFGVIGSLLRHFWQSTMMVTMREGLRAAAAAFREGVFDMLRGVDPAQDQVQTLGALSRGIRTASTVANIRDTDFEAFGRMTPAQIETARGHIAAGRLGELSTTALIAVQHRLGNIIGDSTQPEANVAAALGIRTRILEERRQRDLVAGLPVQMAQAFNIQNPNQFRTQPLPSGPLGFRALTLPEGGPQFNTTGGSLRQQVGDGSNLVNALPASRLAALLAGGTSMNPQMLATTIAATRQSMPLQPLAIASMFGGIGPQSPFGALAAMVAGEMIPAYRGSIVDRSAEGMELPVLPGGKHHGEKFEQMSFNRFMLGGPEVARMEQQVRAQGVENLLQNTNTLIQQGNSTQSQILNRPPPPAVAQ